MEQKSQLQVTLPVTSVSKGIETVEAKIQELKHIQESVYKTSGKISGFNNSIQDEKEISTLIKMHAAVSAMKEAYDKSQNTLGIKTTPVFKLSGFTHEEYESDIKLRIAIIDQKETLDELNAIKKEYTELMDKEDRMALLASRIGKLK